MSSEPTGSDRAVAITAGSPPLLGLLLGLGGAALSRVLLRTR